LAVSATAAGPGAGGGAHGVHRLGAHPGTGPPGPPLDDGWRSRRRLGAARPGDPRGHARRRRGGAVQFRTRATMVTWAPHSGRSEGLAKPLGIRSHFVHYLSFQRPWIAPLKSPLQAVQTLRILWRERPAVVLAQTPPVVAPLIAALYAWATGARFIV